MAKFFKIKITQGDSVGPYNIYYTTTGNTEYQFSKLYGTNDDASLISYNDLVTGDGVSIEVPNDTDRIVVFNTLQECEVYVTHYVITPTPTPTLTATPTHTPTSTPTLTPTPTAVYYYYFLLSCDSSHNKIGRSVTGGLSNTIYNPESGLCYQIVGSDNGPSFDYDLDELTTVSNCSDANCQSTPIPTPTLTSTSTVTPTVTSTIQVTPTTSQTYNMIVENQNTGGVSIVSHTGSFSATWNFSYPLTNGNTGYVTHSGIVSGNTITVILSGSGSYTVNYYRNDVLIETQNLSSSQNSFYTFTTGFTTSDILRVSLTNPATPTPTPTKTATPTPTVTSTPTGTPGATPTLTATYGPLNFNTTYSCSGGMSSAVVSGLTGGSGQYQISGFVYASEQDALDNGSFWQDSSSLIITTGGDGTFWVVVRDKNNPTTKLSKSVVVNCSTPTPTPTRTSTPTLTSTGTPTPTPTVTSTSSSTPTLTPTMTNTLMVTSTPTLTTSQTYNMILENQLSNGISITQFAAGFSATWSFSFPLTQGQTGYMTNYGISSGQSMSVHPSGSGFYTVKIYKNEVFLNSFDLFAPNVFVYTFNENILTTDIIRISLVETPTPTPTPTLTATPTQTPTVTLTSSPLSKSWLITQCGESCNTGICACNNTSTLTVYTLSSVTNLITPGVIVYTNASLTTTWDGYYYYPDSDEVWKFTNGVNSFPNSCAIGVDPCIP